MLKNFLAVKLKRMVLAMTEKFAGSEVVEMGILIERNGRDFYSTLAKQTKNTKIQEVFQFLAVEEEKHIESFQQLLDSILKNAPSKSYNEDYFAYMKALAREHVFTSEGKGCEVAFNIKSDNEAIDIAIGFEKDSIRFFEEMKNIVPEKDKNILDELISIEQEHIRHLADLRDKKILVYSTPTCPYCVRVKKFLKDNNIVFEDIDVSADEEMAKEMMQKSGQLGVPVIDINGEIIIGFDQNRIKQTLGL